MTPATTVTFREDGTFKGLWTEAFDMHSLGELQIERASHIEFNNDEQRWEVKINGEVKFADRSRAACITWEHEFFADTL